MKRPRIIIRPKPFGSSRALPRSRPEAAAELVKVEYERARLERELEQLGARERAAAVNLSKLETRARLLQTKLENQPRPAVRRPPLSRSRP
ncbi:MAG: hypothetical protein K2P95_06695 [Hyphomonadaceae bacterium]|nr:hypothetical protein [Hyphomonadaceae bacterium]